MKPWAAGNAPYNEFVDVTPSDSAGDNFDKPTRALWIGTGGDVSIEDIRGTAFVFTNVPNGTLLPVVCIRVNSTGTVSADDIVALF